MIVPISTNCALDLHISAVSPLAITYLGVAHQGTRDRREPTVWNKYWKLLLGGMKPGPRSTKKKKKKELER
jgi:hypothetical protein